MSSRSCHLCAALSTCMLHQAWLHMYTYPACCICPWMRPHLYSDPPPYLIPKQMKLKKRLLAEGISKPLIDACSGKAELLLCFEAHQRTPDTHTVTAARSHPPSNHRGSHAVPHSRPSSRQHGYSKQQEAGLCHSSVSSAVPAEASPGAGGLGSPRDSADKVCMLSSYP